MQSTFNSSELKSTFTFQPGQYISISVMIDNKEERRSYSLCNGINEPLSIGVKSVENGKVSKIKDLKDGFFTAFRGG